MGNDEHGPAYPEPKYRCPICSGDENRYMDCHYAGCTDGRDPGHPHARLAQKYDPSHIYHPAPSPGNATLLAGWAVIIALLLYSIWPFKAHAMDHGFDPNSATTKWMERQMRPDNPTSSCCGKADAYPVDRYRKLPTGDYEVWIENGDAITYPDGTKREPWDVNISLIVPSNKINKEDDDLDNPTDHGWLFFRPTNDHEPGTFYCFIRHPQGN